VTGIVVANRRIVWPRLGLEVLRWLAQGMGG